MVFVDIRSIAYCFFFSVFDIDGNGVISRQELKETMLKLDSSLTDDHIEAMMAEVDSDNDGSISYIEFAKLMADKW